MPKDDLKQIVLRLSPELHATFKEAAEPDGMQNVCLKLINAYVNGRTEAAVMHIDGSRCPLSELILSLATSVRFEFTNGKRFEELKLELAVKERAIERLQLAERERQAEAR